LPYENDPDCLYPYEQLPDGDFLIPPDEAALLRRRDAEQDAYYAARLAKKNVGSVAAFGSAVEEGIRSVDADVAGKAGLELGISLGKPE
jgi:hypothetical protein